MGLVPLAHRGRVKPIPHMLGVQAHLSAAVNVAQLNSQGMKEIENIRSCRSTAGQGKVSFFQAQIIPNGTEHPPVGQRS